jgi:hypothetical protein
MQINLTLPGLHDAQLYIKANRKRFTVMDCGRRFGKNILEEDLTAETILAGDPLGWFAPNYKILMDSWRRLVSLFAPVTKRKDESEHRLELITGGLVEAWTLQDPNAGRSRHYKRVIVDEAALVPDFDKIWNEAILPTLLDMGGDGVIGSTPKGHNGFWRMYTLGMDPNNPDWKSYHYTTYDNPYIQTKEIDLLKENMTEEAIRQEIMAEFLEAEGAVFRNIAACLGAKETEPMKHKEHRKVMGVDWGKQNDYTAISVVCDDCKCEVDKERFNQIDYAVQRARLVSLSQLWRPDSIIAESNAMGEPIIEQLERDGLPMVRFNTSSVSKPPLIESLALAFERAEVQWIDDPVWTAELEAYERKVSQQTGRSSYSAPEGMHDDTVMARALALHGLYSGASSVIDNPLY